jgi:hypothetical protein
MEVAMRVIARIRRPVAMVVLIWVSACASAGRWRTVPVVPQETKQTLYVGDVRVLTRDGATHGFRGVWVSADSLGGWLTEPAGAARSFALGDVARLDVRRSSHAAQGSGIRTTDKIGALATVVVVGAILVGAVLASWSSGFMQ